MLKVRERKSREMSAPVSGIKGIRRNDFGLSKTFCSVLKTLAI
jgi:hypothetical protein